MNYKELTKKLVRECLNRGADKAEVYLQNARNLSVSVRNNDIEKIEEADSIGIGFRVIVGNRLGFSHCNDFSDKSLQDTIKRAIDFAKLTTSDENNLLPAQEGYTEVEGLYDPEIVKISMDKKINMALELEKLAMKDERITDSSGSGYGERDTEVFIANSNGLSKSYKSGGCSLSVGVVAHKGDQRSSGYDWSSRRFFADLDSLENIAKNAARRAYEMLDPKSIQTQRASVIFEDRVSSRLIGGIIGALNGLRVLRGASFLSDSMNKKFASDLITITDDGTRPKGLASAPFDGEGVPTKKRTLVENGVVKNFYYNTYAASRAGTESTGNASRGRYTSPPGISTHNILVPAGKHTPKQIIEATNKGLLVNSLTGSGLNTTTGDFSGGAEGFWIENGKIQHPVRGLTIAGSAEEVLKGIDMLGDDLDMNRSMITPTLRVKEMQIGGV